MTAEKASPRKGGTKSGKKKLYTLTEVSQETGISMPTLQRYKKSYQKRIPSVGKGRTQRYPREALDVFQEIKKENLKRRGRPPKSGKKKAGGSAKGKSAASKRTEGLLTLTKVAEEAGISYPTALRYVKLHSDRIPHEGSGRKRRFYPEAIEVVEQIRAETPRGRRKKSRGAAPAPRRAAGAAGRTGGGNGRLERRVEAMERSNAALEKQIKDLIDELRKPLKVTINR